MRYELITDLLHHLDASESLKIGYADEKNTEILEQLPIPLDLKRLLQWSWTTCGGQVGSYFLDSVNQIPVNDDYERLLRHKMLPIGYAANGDIVVLRFDTAECSVGLVSHDQLWEGESDPDEAYVELTASIDQYLWRVTEGRYLPIDFYAASEWEELRRELV